MTAKIYEQYEINSYHGQAIKQAIWKNSLSTSVASCAEFCTDHFSTILMIMNWTDIQCESSVKRPLPNFKIASPIETFKGVK